MRVSKWKCCQIRAASPVQVDLSEHYSILPDRSRGSDLRVRCVCVRTHTGGTTVIIMRGTRSRRALAGGRGPRACRATDASATDGRRTRPDGNGPSGLPLPADKGNKRTAPAPARDKRYRCRCLAPLGRPDDNPIGPWDLGAGTEEEWPLVQNWQHLAISYRCIPSISLTTYNL